MQHFKFMNWRIGEFVFWFHEQVIGFRNKFTFLIISDPIKEAEKIEIERVWSEPNSTPEPNAIPEPNSIPEPKPNSDQQTLIIITSSLSGVILLLILGLTLSFYIRKRRNTARIGKYLNTSSLISKLPLTFPHVQLIELR